MENSTKNNKNQQMSMYFATFMDVSGQGSKLRILRDSEWWKLTPETNTLLSDTYGNVQRFRELYQKFFDVILKPSPVEERFLDSNPPEDQLELWNATSNKEMQVKYIADSIISLVPILMKNGILPFRSINYLMAGCCQTILTSFSENRPIRGGIALGPCIFNKETNEVYGSALSIAVELEKEADWPRILVDPGLVRELEVIAKNDQANNLINSNGAKRCLDLVAQDDDGQFILDYLGPGIRQLYEIPEFITNKAKEFILSQVSEYSKLLRKYEKVQEYFKKHGIY